MPNTKRILQRSEVSTGTQVRTQLRAEDLFNEPDYRDEDRTVVENVFFAFGLVTISAERLWTSKGPSKWVLVGPSGEPLDLDALPQLWALVARLSEAPGPEVLQDMLRIGMRIPPYAVAPDVNSNSID